MINNKQKNLQINHYVSLENSLNLSIGIFNEISHPEVLIRLSLFVKYFI